MNKIILILIFGIFLISFISSLDDTQLPQICGGDDELLIGCLGDEELVFLAGEAPAESRGGPFVLVREENITVEEIPIEELKQSILFKIASFFGIRGEDIIFFEAFVIFVLLCLILFIFAKRKKKKIEKKEKDKNQSN